MNHEHSVFEDAPGAEYLNEPRHLHDDELPPANKDSEHYLAGVQDRRNGDLYSQHYAGYIDETTGEHVRPAGRKESLEYHMGYKNGY